MDASSASSSSPSSASSSSFVKKYKLRHPKVKLSRDSLMEAKAATRAVLRAGKFRVKEKSRDLWSKTRPTLEEGRRKSRELVELSSDLLSSLSLRVHKKLHLNNNSIHKLTTRVGVTAADNSAAGGQSDEEFFWGSDFSSSDDDDGEDEDEDNDNIDQYPAVVSYRKVTDSCEGEQFNIENGLEETLNSPSSLDHRISTPENWEQQQKRLSQRPRHEPPPPPVPPPLPDSLPPVAANTLKNEDSQVQEEPDQRPVNPPHKVPFSGDVWYRPDLTRSEAERHLLSDQTEGSFVIRLGSSCQFPYSLSLLHGGRVYHLNIRRASATSYSLGKGTSLSTPSRTFESVKDLILYYANKPLLLVSGRKASSESFDPKNRKEVKLLLNQ